MIATDTTDSHDHDYSSMLDLVKQSFATITTAETVLFQTDVTSLWDVYLRGFHGETRQIHNCHACRRFIETYGGLVTIDERGALDSVMWAGSSDDDFYHPIFLALRKVVENAKVVAPFFSKERVWGTPKTGEYTHLSVTPPPALVYEERLKTPGQAVAAAKEDHRTVVAGLADFKPGTIDEALRLLRAGTLAQSTKFIAPLEWLRKLHDRPKGRAGQNLLWRSVALSPEGYRRPRTAVTGTLLEDLATGMSFELVKHRFDAKLAPLLYQRPQAAPGAGNIKAAEEVIAKLGLAPSLERRFARLDDVQSIWSPKAAKNKAKAEGVFGHLVPKGEEPATARPLPPQIMTWDKFSRKVLPSAEQIKLFVPGNAANFIALVTAVDADAPPIVKWDREEERNPVSWYLYPHGSEARQWGLKPHSWVSVTAVTEYPNQWGSKPMPFLAEGAILLLEGMADSRTDSGNALFPGLLKDDLHGIRATIEAFSKKATLAGQAEASACGYSLRNGVGSAAHLIVFAGGVWSEYKIDRWD